MTVSHNLIRLLVLSIILGMGFYAVSVLSTDFRNVLGAANRLGLSGWAMVLFLSLFNYVLRFARWQGYVKQMGYRLPAWRHLAYYLSGFAFTTTPGKAGEAVRSLYLKREHVTYRHSLAVMFAERFVDMIAMVILAIGTAFAFRSTRWTVLLLAVLVVLTLHLIRSRQLQRFLTGLRARFASNRIRIVLGHMQELLDASSSLLRTAPLYKGIAIGLLAWGAEGLGFYLITAYLGIHTSVILAIGVYSCSVLAGAASFMPGGLGSTEAVMFLFLGLQGADTATAIAATLICRLATLWFAVGIGLLVIGWLELSRRPMSGHQGPGVESSDV